MTTKSKENGWVAIETVKKGDFFRRKPEAKTTFSREDFCRYSKKYEGQDFEDMNRVCYFKKGTLVFINFEF